MWFRRFFKGRKKTDEEERQEHTINQGIFYLYLIIALQVLFVFGIAAVIMVVGKVIATPLWVFVFAFILAVSGGIYVYRKAKRQLGRLRDTFQRANLGDRNYEISFMGGVLRMRVEQNARPLLESPSVPLLTEDTIESPSAHSH